MDHQHVAKELVDLLGGKENIVSATHCATRLRIVLDDDSKAQTEVIEDLDGVKGAFASSGQFQIIFGTGLVNKVYASFAKETGLAEESKEKVDHQQAVKKKMNPLARLAKTLSNIFVPIIPAIVASGLLMGLLNILKNYNLMDPESAVFVFLDMFSSAAFIILPILIGYSTAREFGGNPMLGAVIGGIMTHPALTNPWGLAEVSPEHMDFFGMEVALLGYQGTVIPVLLTVYIMCKIERALHRIVPNAIDLLVTPFITVMSTGFIAMLAVGPFGRLLGEGITGGLAFLIENGGAAAGFVFGGLYSAIVMTGIHHSFHAIEAEYLNEFGINVLLPIWSMANVAQGGAGLAVFFMTKRAKTKGIALPASLSAFLGITEPIIFGVNIRYRRPFIGAAIGGALGGAFTVWQGVSANAFGVTGFTMIPVANNIGIYLISLAIAISAAFIATWLLGIKEDNE